MDKIKGMVVCLGDGSGYSVRDSGTLSEADREKDVLVFFPNGNVYGGRLSREFDDDGYFRLMKCNGGNDTLIKLDDIVGWAYKDEKF